ncbi:MAG TPA: choice-of-anchor tandem repeat GloVer-containing protein, partial [Chthoniobacterales bacterium]|nr:choice-of-anchor tandem repeat GloVer-containing protein [Chthoniobacterales bacterium]
MLGASVHAATIETLASLGQPPPAFPQVRFSNGTFYGAVFGDFNGGFTHGSILKLGQDGALTSLYDFQAATQDEANPTVVIAGTDGNLYGATGPKAVGDVNGMIFKLTSAGTFTPIYHFQDSKGTHATTLVQAADGNFYGTAAGDSSGGFFNHPASLHNPGIFFRLTPAGVFTVLYTFTGGADGSFPNSLVQGKDGNFYGSTYYGPETPPNLFNGNGTIFKITPTGVLTTLCSFTGASDGANPGNVVEGADGNLYGIADSGTTRTVFKLTPAGQRTTVYNLQGTNGTASAGLLASTDGNVYGTTKDGGIPKAGTIFRITPAGQVSTWAFDGAGTGGQPSRPFEGAEHSLYGATAVGGTSNKGTVYRLNMAPPRDLLNISTRLQVLTGDKVLIGGFIITGTDPKKIIVRGIGPSLSGVGGTLPDPILELHQGNTTLATNDDWKEHQAEVEATTIPPTNNLESAIVATLTPGAYTAILSGKNDGTGVGVVEVYDLDQTANSKLANISTRGFVDIGSNVMIGGLIVSGGANGGSARAIVRAIGPSLTPLGVPGALSDPNLELHDASGA